MTEANPPLPTPSVDLGRVMAEIEEDVRHRRDVGDLSTAGDRELDVLFRAHSPSSSAGGTLAHELESVDRAAFVDPVVPIDSNRKVGAVAKKAMRSASLWYVGWVTHQFNQFAAATSRSLHVIERRLDEHEVLMRDEGVPRGEVVEFVGVHSPDAWWVDVAISAVVEAPGRILHAACDDGWLVRAIAAAGGDSYGVDPRPMRIPPESGETDLRVVDLAEHLRTVAPSALGAVVLSGVVEGMAGGERNQLLRLVTDRLAPGGVLVIHSVTTTLWGSPDAPPEADLSPGKPLRGASWCRLLGGHEYDPVLHMGPDGADYLVTATRRSVAPPSGATPRQ
ncbi:MAG: class I SAM-dependent methyltransferase [Acidimicrobiales bacterium]